MYTQIHLFWLDKCQHHGTINWMSRPRHPNKHIEKQADYEHDFTLVLDGFTDLTPEIVEALLATGCDDGTISVRCGRPFITFSRRAPWRFWRCLRCLGKVPQSNQQQLRFFHVLHCRLEIFGRECLTGSQLPDHHSSRNAGLLFHAFASLFIMFNTRSRERCPGPAFASRRRVK